MIVEKIEMASGQAVDLGQCIVYLLRVKATATLKECVLVTKIAMLGASARHDDGIRHQIVVALDEVATNWRNSLQCAAFRGGVNTQRCAGTKVVQKLREGLFAGAEKDSVRMDRGLIGKRSNVQSAKADKCAQTCIGAGEQRKVEFPLKPALTYSARGKIELPADYKHDFEPLWGLRREDGQYYGQWTDEEFDHTSGTWEIRHLPRGTYYLELQSGIYDTDLIANKSFTITDADVNDLVLPMRLRFSLSAKVRLPEGFHPSTPYSVLFKLEPDGTSELTEDGQPVAKDGEVVFNRLQPGHYRLYLFTDDPVYIKSARLGDQNALNGGLCAAA